MLKLAFIVSHPVQYYVPLYRRLAARRDIAIKVFFTWHAGTKPVHDEGFRIAVEWDIPLTDGYDFTGVVNTAVDPGTHHFLGLVNPDLVRQLLVWDPDVVHVTGWAWMSHLLAMRACTNHRIPVLFRGDSNLLGTNRHGPSWWLKSATLAYVYQWPTAFLVVGSANHDYYRAFGVPEERLFRCTHSIDVSRFAEPSDRLEREARAWRRELGIDESQRVVLFAGKFEARKRPVEFMRAVLALRNSGVIGVMVGNGELESDIRAVAECHPETFVILPFQNQTRMPLVYRLGDLFVLPSSHGETWGLAVNEAMASGRSVLVSDRVGCAADVVVPSCGRVFSWSDPSSLERSLLDLIADRPRLIAMGAAASRRSWSFDMSETERSLLETVQRVCR